MQTFEFDNWKTTAAPECGGNLASLYWKDHKITRSFASLEEWTAPRACYGFPILFPPNRIEDGKFKLDAVEYSLPVNEQLRSNHLHGIPIERVWELRSVTQNSITMSWAYTEDDPCYKNYPFDCTLEVTYTFLEKEMIQDLVISNTGKLTMPCALGYHSAFIAPEKAFVSGTGKCLATEAENRFLPDGTETEWIHGFAPNEWFAPKEVTKYGLFRTGGTAPRALLDYGNDFVLEYLPDEKFSWWLLWRPVKDSSYFCTEPMNIPVNCHNYSPADLPLLSPGEKVCYTSRLRIRTS